MININYPTTISDQKIKKFFISKGLKEILNFSNIDRKPNDMILKNPYPPDLKDLYRLYQFVLKNNRTTILEFGTGWSSLIFLLALNEIKRKKFNSISKIRRNNKFELFIVDNEKKFLNISKKRINKFIKKLNLKNPPKINYLLSSVKMTTFQGRISTEYVKLPNCNPDFIYVDGPDQFNVKGKINGISTRHKDMMPMQCDLLKIEYFLIPGTIIVVDGRASNSKFLKDFFKRKWIYKNHVKFDQHSFVLDDPVLGKINSDQLKFYKNKI